MHGRVRLTNGTTLDEQTIRAVIDEEYEAIRAEQGEAFEAGRWKQAREVFEQVALADEFVDFLTLPAYELID
jgi:malate synthase